MAVTMGFVLRVDSYPPAVAIPPMQQNSIATAPVIEAKIIEPSLSAGSGRSNSHNALRYAIPAEQSPLTYSRQGGSDAGANTIIRGQLVNIYA